MLFFVRPWRVQKLSLLHTGCVAGFFSVGKIACVCLFSAVEPPCPPTLSPAFCPREAQTQTSRHFQNRHCQSAPRLGVEAQMDA